MRRLGVITMVLCGILPLAACDAGGTDEPETWEGRTPRILVLGDSLSQGRAGDVTWRGRLAEHLEAVGQDVDFVGPRKGVQDPASYVGVSWPESEDYGAASFDTDHAARWGQTVGFLETAPDELVAALEPDIVVIQLGTNDLSWLNASGAEVGDQLESLVRILQHANPDIDVVLSQLPSIRLPGGAEVNGHVDDLVDELDTERSRVVVAPINEGYDEDATWDGLHPNPRGESVIARGVATALDELGVGDEWGQKLADPGALPPGRPRLTARVGSSIYLTWDEVSWADGYHVLTRREQGRKPTWEWHSDAAGNAAEVGGLEPGATYEIAVQPFRGTMVASEAKWSTRVTVTPRAAGRPALPAPRTRTSDQGLAVTWRAVPGAKEYWLWYRSYEVDRVFGGKGTWRVRRVTDPSADLEDLVPGLAYQVAVQAHGQAGPTAMGAVTDVVGPGTKPEAPEVEVRTDTGVRGTAVLAWEPSEHATRHDVWYRLAGGTEDWVAYNTAGVLTAPRVTLLGLVPGARYEVVVKSFNGALQGKDSSATFVAEE